MWSDINTAQVESVLHALYPMPASFRVWCDGDLQSCDTPGDVRKFLDSTGDVAQARIEISPITTLFLDDTDLTVVHQSAKGVEYWRAEFRSAPIGLVVGAINTSEDK